VRVFQIVAYLATGTLVVPGAEAGGATGGAGSVPAGGGARPVGVVAGGTGASSCVVAGGAAGGMDSVTAGGAAGMPVLPGGAGSALHGAVTVTVTLTHQYWSVKWGCQYATHQRQQ